MTNERVMKAVNAMKALGVSREAVNPVLRNLLIVYDKNWAFIEAENYRVLADAIFDRNYDKGVESNKKKKAVDYDNPERPLKKLHLKTEEDEASSTIDSTSALVTKDDNKIAESDSNSPVEIGNEQILSVASTSKFNSAIPNSLEGSSTGNAIIKPLRLMDRKNKRFSSKSKYERSSHSYDIASSGDIKLSINHNYALQSSNFQPPNIDNVLKTMEKTLLRSYKITDPSFSLTNLLQELCKSFSEKGPDSEEKSLVQQFLADDTKRKKRLYIEDITKGEEKVKISLVDEEGEGDIPKFFYIARNLIYQKAHVNISLARISDEDCCSSCSGNCLSSLVPCTCTSTTNGEFAYTQEGLVKDEFLTDLDPKRHRFFFCQDCPFEWSKNEKKPESCKGHLMRRFMKECWSKCGCNINCGNRVVQRGITRKLQVFWARGGKGWGVRTMEGLPRGAFVCEYVGEIVTNTELYERNLQSNGKDKHTYPVQLDADFNSESILNDDFALCLDATFYGNVARFVNHRCHDANLIGIPVSIETVDHHYYHLAFFTTRSVKPLEELTWDYGIDFDDHTHPVKAFRCCCGSTLCRDNNRKAS